jgi:hypothetical protein
MNEIAITIPISWDHLPTRLLWEEDGSCWKGDFCSYSSSGWRWFPMNCKALAKNDPEGPMTDFILPKTL